MSYGDDAGFVNDRDEGFIESVRERGAKTSAVKRVQEQRRRWAMVKV
jgi:hypothetical protein